ncbi:hypothetical protein POKO110462_12865 [Pontibacter korlensis]|uniref:Uncharacterized protein n=1 Tax=Pontibacter korlensis TaxID=400092 RepID=A0A0E3UX86_9BACT|nr:hypothetical protein [Pontibacter korlensis]AKD04017.1 hypothetical protein PKOR_14070 [Pontibacter korlensis]
MEDQNKRDMTVFHQICEVNELDPNAITEKAKERFPEKFENGPNVERLIWTALNHRAGALIQDLDQSADSDGDKAAYSIDGDPAAPGFVVNEENIRSQYSPEVAEKIIDALGQVQMPIRA